MIWIFNLKRASAGVCDNYHDVFRYISSLEKPQTVRASGKDKNNLNDLQSLSEADIKQWCLEFCKGHNYDIIETPCHHANTSHSTIPPKSPWQIEERYKHAS